MKMFTTESTESTEGSERAKGSDPRSGNPFPSGFCALYVSVVKRTLPSNTPR